MKTLFVVTLFNDADYIQNTLLSILKQQGGRDYDILVVDDGSADQSPSRVRELAQKYPQIRMIVQKHQGQAAALNRALKKTTGYDFVALVESDVRIEPLWLSKNLEKFSAPQIAAVGGKLEPEPRDNWIARLAGYEVEYKLARQKNNPLHLTSANIIYCASIFPQIGEFDATLHNACFDLAFNLRLRKSGFRLVYNREAAAWHHYKASLFAFLKRVWAYARFRPRLKNIAAYPYDYVIHIQIILIAILLAALLCALWLPRLFLTLAALTLCLYFILTLPPLIWTLKHRRDKVMLFYPIVSLLRNSVALAAIIFGILEDTFSKKQKI